MPCTRQEGARVFLDELGWNGYFEALWKERFRDESENPTAARVVSQQRGLWRIGGEFVECWAEPSGKLRGIAEVEGESAWPAVGDWVAAEIVGEDRAILHWVLPRRGVFSRKAPGKRVEQQVIAANVDMAFLVAALDMDFSPRRLERYLAQCWDSGVRPAIVLNKADECKDVAAHVASTERVAIGAPVLALSARMGQGMETLEALLSPGKTIVLLGSSGVGKSTLVNRLLREEKQSTRPTREEARVDNRRMLEREQEFQRRKSDPEAMQEYKTKVSRMMRGVREKYKQREREGKQ